MTCIHSTGTARAAAMPASPSHILLHHDMYTQHRYSAGSGSASLPLTHTQLHHDMYTQHRYSTGSGNASILLTHTTTP
ncbi:hypothetical protein FKM82_029124 [Ascaphus truei]